MKDYRARPLSTWLMLAPFALAFAIFVLVPLAMSFAMSLRKGTGSEQMAFAGLRNYRFLLGDGAFWLATLNTIAFTVVFLILEVPLCLAIATGLRSGYARFRSFARFALLCPYFIGPVYASVLFSSMLDTRYGSVNKLLSILLHRDIEIPFLSDPRLSLVSMVMVALWLGVGFGSLYLAAAMQNIPRGIYDAARVDGASPWKCFWHITLPSVRPMLAFLILVGTIQAFQLFELPYVLFGGPGPSSAGMTVVMYLYGVGFEAGDFAYASAVGWAIVALLGIVMLIQYFALRPMLKRRQR